MQQVQNPLFVWAERSSSSSSADLALLELSWNCPFNSKPLQEALLSGLKEELHQWIESGFNSFEFTYEKGRKHKDSGEI